MIIFCDVYEISINIFMYQSQNVLIMFIHPNDVLTYLLPYDLYSVENNINIKRNKTYR
jgi:hypothetical protein